MLFNQVIDTSVQDHWAPHSFGYRYTHNFVYETSSERALQMRLNHNQTNQHFVTFRRLKLNICETQFKFNNFRFVKYPINLGNKSLKFV